MADKKQAGFTPLSDLPTPQAPVSTHDAPQQIDKGGRPTLFTAEIAASICEQLSAGLSLRRICRAETMPHESTVRAWALSDEEFGKAYREARDIGLDAVADETLDIADDGTNDTQVDAEGNAVTNYDHIQRSRLRVDTRKWYLSKLAPKRYGDTARIEHTGAEGGPIEISWMLPTAAPIPAPGDTARDVTPPAPQVLEARPEPTSGGGGAVAVEWSATDADAGSAKPKRGGT